MATTWRGEQPERAGTLWVPAYIVPQSDNAPTERAPRTLRV
jgi:hypothetical protein